MVPMGTNTDEWIADVASYVRNSFGNAAPFVTPERVAAVRKANPRTSMWTFAELVSTTPMPLAQPGAVEGDGQPQHGGGRERHHRRGHDALGERRRAGTGHVVPDRAAAAGQRRRDPGRRRWPAAAAGSASASAAAAAAFPAGPLSAYSVQVSMDGTAWSEPVAEGQGQNPTTTIAVKPVQARFVRITQTGTPPTAAAGWAIQRVRIFTARSVTREARDRDGAAEHQPGDRRDARDVRHARRRPRSRTSSRAPSQRLQAWRQHAVRRARTAADRAPPTSSRSESEQLGRLMTLEMGKPLRAGHRGGREVRARVPLLRRERRRAFSPTSTCPPRRTASYIRYEPLGVVLAIMPWNFPFWQVFRFAAPALMAGNVGLLKHASNVPQCALAIEDIFARAGFPDGVFQTLLIGSPTVAPLIADPRVQRGNAHRQRGGRRTWRRAPDAPQEDRARARRQRPVHRDAERRPREAVGDRRQGADDQQRAVVHRRQALHRRRADRRRFVRRSSRRWSALQRRRSDGRGDRARPARDAAISSTISRAQVKRDRRGGRAGPDRRRAGSRARATTSRRPCSSTSRATRRRREELFGPVASVFRVQRVDEAIRIANDTTFGLGASVWTNETRARSASSRELEAGQVFVNAMVVSDPRLPFGGVSARATAASSACTASASSSTSRPCGSPTEPTRDQLSPPDHSSDARRGPQRCRHA